MARLLGSTPGMAQMGNSVVRKRKSLKSRGFDSHHIHYNIFGYVPQVVEDSVAVNTSAILVLSTILTKNL